MSDKRLIPHKKYSVNEWTDFGKEVENDEINWWVFKREHDIPQLRKHTNLALTAAQTLKEDSAKLSKGYYQSVDDLVRVYGNFSIKYQKEITIILEYIQWLFQKDELAPSILFNYRVWGSTRMGDRLTEVDKNSLDDRNMVEQFSMIVLGLIHGDRSVMEMVKKDLESDFFDTLANMDPEYYSGQQGTVKPEHIQRRAAEDAVAFFAEYWVEIRDCLRNVLIDIEQRELQERLFTSDDFWRSFIEKAANSTKTEPKYWDFKETLEIWHIKSGSEKDKKAHNFTERVAGFANNAGGVILIGVTDDPPRQIVGLGNNSREIENNMKYTRQVIGDYIENNLDFVHFQQVNVSDKNGVIQLCLVIAIQQTYEVLSVKGLDGKSFSYPFREEAGVVFKDSSTIRIHKTGVKSSNFDFLRVLLQFVNEDI